MSPMEQGTLQPLPVLLSVAFPYAPVGMHAVGGAEVICSHLEAALPSLGFRSVVVAHAESKPAGLLYGTAIPPGQITDETRAVVEAAHQRNIDRACLEHRIALIHMHGLDFARYRLPANVPVLVTLHLPPSWYGDEIWNLPAHYHLVCVSDDQRRACPASVQPRLAVIGNGVPLPDRSTLRPEGRYALMMARICPEKNLHTGLDAAKLAQIPAVLAGDVFPYEAHLRYFEDEVRPRLTRFASGHEQHAAASGAEPQARFLGPVAGAEKDRLLRRAGCLLLPSLAPETSSLVAMEALAAGVPVVAMAVGAVPEIVEDGRTGFVIAPGEGATERMAEAIRRVPQLHREACREAAEQRFPLAAMVERYALRYRELLQSYPTENATQGVVLKDAETLVVEPVPTTAALEALRAEWTAAWHRDTQATAFQHPAWLLPWWRQFGPDGQLQSLAIREKSTGKLVALLPSYTYRNPLSGKRQLLLLGAGTTDYLDGVWSPACAPKAARLALEFLLQSCDATWDVCGFTQLRKDSSLVAAAQAVGLFGVPAEPTSTLRSETDLLPKIRTNLSRYRRLAEARGALACVLATEPQEALISFEHLVHLHGERWQARGEEGVLSDARVLAHHRESLPKLLEAGLLRLFRLTLDGETLGVLYGLADGPQAAERCLYLYLIGFEDRFADLSPGSLLLQEAWLHARAHGLARLDLLRGGENYKKLWGAVTEDTVALVMPS